MLESGDYSVLYALKELRAKEAIPALHKLESHREPGVRAAAARAIEAIRGKTK